MASNWRLTSADCAPRPTGITLIDSRATALWHYENIGLTPDEIAALRDENDRLYAALKLAQARAGDYEAEADAWRSRAEAGEKDIREMLYESRLLVDNALCPWCERYDEPHDLCWAGSCKEGCKWRGPDAPSKEDKP